jgi:hypothetical protein
MKEYWFKYGPSVFDVVIIRPGAIKHWPRKISLWLQINYLKIVMECLKLRKKMGWNK